MKTTRELFLPGPGAPHWLPASKPPGGLLYLGWGQRRYGKHPIPQRLHHGWTYMIVLSGNPVLLSGTRRHAAEKGSLIIIGPDAPFGWIDRPSDTASLLTWEWSSPPVFQSPLRKNARWLAKCSAAALEEIKNLHLLTRREIQQSDSRSPRVLKALKSMIDVALERSAGDADDHVMRDSQRLQLAESWMRRHLDIRTPAESLADYLGISAMTLQRLFMNAAGLSPGRAFLEIKMNEAANLLSQPQKSVKEVALALGYRHSGDFTRAFKRRFGIAPNEFASLKSSRKEMP